MTYALFLAFSLAVLVVCFLAARRHNRRIQDLGELEKRMQPVDLAAFRNLINPAEEKYLRAHLSQKDFRIVQRKRALAAVAYVRATAQNAAILLRLAEAARSSPEPEVAKAAQQLVHGALFLRMQAWFALWNLSLVVVFPQVHVSSGGFVHACERLTHLFATFARLERPAYAGRISAMF